jgi:antagonist of KipI
MDRFAHLAANRLVGNTDNAGTLEITLVGPQLIALRECLIAITGGDLNPELNGDPIPGWTSIKMVAGDQLRFGRRRRGARAYFAIAGGFSGDRWLGSLSTSLLVGRGGVDGRPLRSGDELSQEWQPTQPIRAGRQLPEDSRPTYPVGVTVLDAVPGPQIGRLSPESQKLFFSQEYVLTPASDRMGYRLEGAPALVAGPELVSIGLAFGCVQMPWVGKPILLMADHQTAGGYPVVAGVVRADLGLAAQLAPGDSLQFRRTTVEAGQRRWQAMMAALESVNGPS